MLREPQVGDDFLSYCCNVLCHDCWYQVAESYTERGCYICCTHLAFYPEVIVEGSGNYYEILFKLFDGLFLYGLWMKRGMIDTVDWYPWHDPRSPRREASVAGWCRTRHVAECPTASAPVSPRTEDVASATT